MRCSIFIGLFGLTGVLSLFAQTPHMVPAGGSYIGVMMQEVDGERAKALKLPEATGVEITLVEPDGPAEKAGLKVGDVVLRYNGQRVEGNDQFARLVRETPSGHEVKLDISRAGAPQTITVRIGLRKTPRIEWGGTSQAPNMEIHMPDMPRTFMQLRSSILGVEAESVDGQLAQYFGVKEGVLVRSVSKGSAAEKAGIRAGDVIVKIDDTHIATPADISSRLHILRGKSAPIVLMRDHKELTVTVAISDDEPGRIQITPFQVNPNQFD
ncbi:MAG TPA: PDZ domain-containing protein [Bryobacteraceae bacterium]|jgi:serine protease Do|nr:PDZ domain-containing protein [Bryobacteraceae bacterium]